MHIAISRGLARYLEDVEGFDGESFEIVHYGIDPDGEPSPYAGETPRLLCVGRLIPIKGHIVLLRAFAEAKRDLPDLQLDIAGRGPLEPALKAVAGELGIADSVHFLGHVSPIQSAIEGATVVVVPSMGEGFGMVALEAMERARPVIAAAIGGLGELVRDGETGLLVPAGEAEPLRAAIVRLAGDLDLARRMGEAGRRRALTRFLQQFCTDRTDLLYQGALEPALRDEVRAARAGAAAVPAGARLEGSAARARARAHAREARAPARDGAQPRPLDSRRDGTYTGETAWAFRHEFDRIETIELEPSLARLARIRFGRTSSVHVHEGDSASVLPEILESLDRPALFWLDAHPCTDRSATDAPGAARGGARGGRRASGRGPRRPRRRHAADGQRGLSAVEQLTPPGYRLEQVGDVGRLTQRSDEPRVELRRAAGHPLDRELVAARARPAAPSSGPLEGAGDPDGQRAAGRRGGRGSRSRRRRRAPAAS